MQGPVYTMDRSEEGFVTGGKDGMAKLWDSDFKNITTVNLANAPGGYKGNSCDPRNLKALWLQKYHGCQPCQCTWWLQRSFLWCMKLESTPTSKTSPLSTLPMQLVVTKIILVMHETWKHSDFKNITSVNLANAPGGYKCSSCDARNLKALWLQNHHHCQPCRCTRWLQM